MPARGSAKPAAYRFQPWRAKENRWAPPSADDWMSVLRSVGIARDLMFWKKSEFKASGIGGDYAAVQHLSDALGDAVRELEQAAEVCFEAQTRLLTVAVETPPQES